MSHHGLPCWYELACEDIAAAKPFYKGLLGWKWADSGMPGMTYLLAQMGKTAVAGAYRADPGTAPAWKIYFAVENADATLAQATALGATILSPPADIPGTGRIAVLNDPQGAAFGILQPEPGGDGGAFAPSKKGHGNWQDLVTTDAAAALAFYTSLFGWTVSRSMPMGPEMTYHILARGGVEIGGCFASQSQPPFWKPYFGVASAKAAKAKASRLQGTVLHGPDQVPGGLFTLQVVDAQGVVLGLVGPA